MPRFSPLVPSILALMMASSGLVFAQQPPPDIPDEESYTPLSEEDVPVPPKITEEEEAAPSVIIREEEDRTVEEYRQNGVLYMVKVTPSHGVPYYYMDSDGDGTLELQPGNELQGPTRPVLWKVKEW